ncbi:MAG: hypothetical protein P4L31_07290 [Candidatus Babeliales bacterium]|nr:hypothetical protein [Candidatus Babeliales bacterium]
MNKQELKLQNDHFELKIVEDRQTIATLENRVKELEDAMYKIIEDAENTSEFDKWIVEYIISIANTALNKKP